MIKLAVFFAAPLLAAGAAVWGWSGAASVTLAVAIVLVNFALGAAMIALGARLGGSAMAAAVTGGYLLRLGIVAVAVLPVADHDWFEIAPFAVSLLVTHLGLLAVETRRVSLSLAFPGLKPDVARRPATSADATAARAGAPAVGSASADALGAVEERPS